MTKKRWESGASEVIGAVLLVSLVVIGGAVVAAFVFGQPAPKEVPRVNFGVSLDSESDILTLHHTGGDSLLNGTYGVIIDGVPVETYRIPEEYRDWSADGILPISNVTDFEGSIVLTYLDNAGGETVLRKVNISDNPSGDQESPAGPWTVSGYKFNVTANGQRDPLPDVTIRLTKKDGTFDFPEAETTTDLDGHYSFTVPAHAGTYNISEDGINWTRWMAVNPAAGQHVSVALNHHQTSMVRNFSNKQLPPPPWTISGHKYNVTWKGEILGPLDNVTINLTTTDEILGFPAEGKTTKTNETGYYEFEVPGYWEDEIPAILPHYRLTEDIDRIVWMPHNPVSPYPRDASSSVIENVAPDSTDNDFYNEKLIPNKKISGYKYGYYNNTPWLIGPVEGIRIDLTLTSGDIPDMQVGQTNTTTTNESGYYEFIVSGYPALYVVKEFMEPDEWTPWIPANGMYTNVPPGATRDFKNHHVRNPMGGEVIRLEKTEAYIQGGSGYLVGGTFLQLDTTNKDYLWIGGSKYTFGNGDKIRLVLDGDQDRGRMTVTKGGTDLVEWSFNTTVQKLVNGVWTTIASGPITDIKITNINKNRGVTGSNLTYMHAPYLSNTMLRLNGEPVITSPPDDQTPFEFTNLHIVHDNRYHEGNNIMWIWLEPGNNSLLVQGDYVYL